MEKGLIDSNSPEELDCKLLEAQRRWDSLESMEKMGANPAFSKYFTTCVADSMREGMITSIRKAAGIGENLYFNNASESLHFQYRLQIQSRTDGTLSGKRILKSTICPRLQMNMLKCAKEQPETWRELLSAKGYTD